MLITVLVALCLGGGWASITHPPLSEGGVCGMRGDCVVSDEVCCDSTALVYEVLLVVLVFCGGVVVGDQPTPRFVFCLSKVGVTGSPQV